MRCKACDTVWLVSGLPEEIAPNASEPRAAVVKRGAEREHRDLFASRPLDMGSVKQTLRPSPLPAGFPDESQQLAARNEASVLFTVDALRETSQNSQNARVKTPAPSIAPPPFVEDDSGVIDLNALASIPPRVGRVAVAPLFSDPPPAAFASDVDGPSPSSMVAMPGGFRLSKRAIAGIGAAAVALVLCCIGISAAFKGEDPVSRSAATNMITAPIAIAATPATPAAPAASPAAPTADPAPPPAAATASTDDDDKTAKAGKKKKIKSGGGAKASFASSPLSGKASTTVAASPKAPKAADKCGCKGDFNCIIRCTATGK